jgi:electron transfer flavoprotein alpha subunit
MIAAHRALRAVSARSRGFSTLLLATQDAGKLDKMTLNAATGAAALKAGPMTVLVVGAGADAAAKDAAAIAGVEKVLSVEAGANCETTAALIQKLQEKNSFTHIVGASSTWCKDVLPRAAALLDVQPISDVVSVKDDSTFVRPMYAGNAMATVKSKDATKVVTFRPTSFDAAASQSPCGVETVAADDAKLSEFLEVRSKPSDKPQLQSAERVVAGGRALKSQENFDKVLEPLCTKWNAALGASRAAVDSGYAANELQVGQTGKVVAPNLYAAVGISGAIQHLAGMKDSKCIVAINKDPEAPIMQVADLAVVGDLFDVVPELTSKSP